MAAIIPQLFDVHTASADINQFLDQLAHNPDNRFRIHPRVISYKSKNMKNNAIQLALEADRRDYEACDIMQQAKHTMVSSSSLLWLSGNITGIQQNGNHWHSYALIYFERKVFVIDPEYQPPAPGRVRRLVEIEHLDLAKEFIPLISGSQNTIRHGVNCWGRVVDHVYLCGTGHIVQIGTGQCNPETGGWMQQFVRGGGDMSWFDRHDVEEVIMR
ncbi:hypothetical protein EV426DRAFT_581412 [Tirmania nivea]|nr:hypothetical protein EV426DRAFT_581412 [Tirmania nivea]